MTEYMSDKGTDRLLADLHAGHTPTPWKINEGFIVGPDFETVADPRCIPPTDENIRTMDANAAIICRAVNSHAELLEILRDHARQLDSLSSRLAANVPPGHVDYLNKSSASEWAMTLANECRIAIARAAITSATAR